MRTEIQSLLKQTYAEWSDDRAARLAAALAYYTLFSLAPLLVVSIALAGLVFSREAVQGQIVNQIGGLVGHDSAVAIQELLANTNKPAKSLFASIVGFAVLLFGAAGIVSELKDSLNTIWDVSPSSAGFWGMIRARATSLALVLGVGFALLVSLVISAGLAAAGRYFDSILPGNDAVWIVVGSLITLGIEIVLFALIFKLPDIEVAWSDLWVGAAVTAVLFEVGKLAVGIYLGSAGIGSAYGAAGSLVVVLVWVYYSAQILFLGAEFTQVYARRRRSSVAQDRFVVTEVPSRSRSSFNL